MPHSFIIQIYTLPFLFHIINALPFFSSHIPVLVLVLVLPSASQSSVSLQLCLHSQELQFPKKCLYLPHPPECWCQQSVRASPGHDAAATRRFWWNASQADKGQVTPISSISIGLLTKFPLKGFSRGWITQGSQIRSQAQAARFWRVCSAGRWQRIQVENHNDFPQTMHFARANMQSWSVKSLLHFVVCFIVWMGEYHTLSVAPLYILFPYSTQFFGVLCLLYPSLLITRCLLSRKLIYFSVGEA